MSSLSLNRIKFLSNEVLGEAGWQSRWKTILPSLKRQVDGGDHLPGRGGSPGGQLLPGLSFQFFVSQCDVFKLSVLTLCVSCLYFNGNRLIKGLT